jgi:hypothetical protein
MIPLSCRSNLAGRFMFGGLISIGSGGHCLGVCGGGGGGVYSWWLDTPKYKWEFSRDRSLIPWANSQISRQEMKFP